MTLPKSFEDYTLQLMGAERFTRLCQALDTPSPVSIRFNPFKTTNEERQSMTFPGHEGERIKQTDKVSWCNEGHYLESRPVFTLDPLLHAGAYYVQEASSMFIDHVIREYVTEPVKMLDLCAAPGGKTTAVRAALPEGSLLFCNEPVKLRANILSENMQKFGHPEVIVTNNYPKDYARSGLRFDVILADVPCSGEGMFRKDEDAVRLWSPQNVEKCRDLQREIIETIWPCLNAGGILIYSTCTYNAKEDEENIAWIAENLDAEVLKVPVDDHWDITGPLVGNNPVCRFLPGYTMGEGLFMAVLRKRGEQEEAKENKVREARQRKKEKGKQDHQQPTTAYQQWLKEPVNFHWVADRLVAMPQQWDAYYLQATKYLHILHAGITIGTAKGKDLVPDESLALSTALSTEAFPRWEADYHEALQYLHREAVALPAEMPKGYVLVTYQGHPLGFVKNLGSRANNLYPKEWKIKIAL
jgi:16S rRNA C967 or C1407 C5-methylase (RsmB/RsmF family)/NOL1/NOP2/fmu family ribosome biogenesis protein